MNDLILTNIQLLLFITLCAPSSCHNNHLSLSNFCSQWQLDYDWFVIWSQTLTHVNVLLIRDPMELMYSLCRQWSLSNCVSLCECVRKLFLKQKYVRRQEFPRYMSAEPKSIDFFHMKMKMSQIKLSQGFERCQNLKCFIAFNF